MKRKNLVQTSFSDWPHDSATHLGIAGYHYDAQNVTMCNRSLKQKAISLSSCEAEFHAASACAGELLGFAKQLKNFMTMFQLYCNKAGGDASFWRCPWKILPLAWVTSGRHRRCQQFFLLTSSLQKNSSESYSWHKNPTRHSL